MSDTPDHVPLATAPRQRHWDAAYAGRGEQQVSWYQADPHMSAELIGDHAATMAAGKDSAIIDAGGGGSLLAARLVATGFTDVTVLDVSRAALTAAARRPGGAHVTWIHADLLDWQPPRRYHIWHDRAVFHFLTSPGDRAAYLATLRAALAGGGAIVLATFAARRARTLLRATSRPLRRRRAGRRTQRSLRRRRHHHRASHRAAPHPGRGDPALHLDHRPPDLKPQTRLPSAGVPGTVRPQAGGDARAGTGPMACAWRSRRRLASELRARWMKSTRPHCWPPAASISQSGTWPTDCQTNVTSTSCEPSPGTYPLEHHSSVGSA